MVETVTKKAARKHRIGIVVSNKMKKTIVVQVFRKALHAHYGKVVEKAKKFKAHDEENKAQIGDKVLIVETRPLSKDKRWRLVEVLSHGHMKSDTDIKDVLARAPEGTAL